MENKEFYFTTGELARLTGLSKQLLIFYDKKNFFTATATGSNGYRYYLLSKYFQLKILITLRKMDIPLEEIYQYLQHGSDEFLLSIYKRKLSEYQEQMKHLKYDLTFRLWEYGSTSQVKAIQYQSINQSFRMVGSINDKHGTELVAFRTGERVTLDYLNAYAKPENRVDVNKPFSPSKMTRAEAREAYPEWYERVVVRGEKGRKKWDIAGKVHGDDPYALYHWWLRQIGEIKGGHRYFFLMCLAIYAYKCGVSKQQLRQDMKEAFDDLQMVKHENALTEEDIRSALEAYDKEYYNFTISDIEALTDVRIERNKRNGRSQKEHLKRARAVQEVDYPGGTWRRKGAEEKKAQVYAWRQEHPEGRKADCHRDTGLDPKTIRKWWDTVPEGHITVKIRPSQALSDLLVEEFKKGL